MNEVKISDFLDGALLLVVFGFLAFLLMAAGPDPFYDELEPDERGEVCTAETCQD